MDSNHIMTADEIDAIFKSDGEENKEEKPEIRVTFIKAERVEVSPGLFGCSIKCAIWNDSPQKVTLMINSYVINDKREQHRPSISCSGYAVTGAVTIRPNAHVIKGDIFFEEYTGIASPGWIYGVEITDMLNKEFDTEFELKADGEWQKKE